MSWSAKRKKNDYLDDDGDADTADPQSMQRINGGKPDHSRCTSPGLLKAKKQRVRGKDMAMITKI